MARISTSQPALLVPALLLGGCSLLLGACSLLLDPEITAKPDAGTPGGADSGATGDTGGPPSGDLGDGGAAYGAACEGDLDCASLRCRDRRCSAPCSAAQACPADPASECRDGLCRFLAAPPLAGPPKVGLIYVGPVGDHGWSKTHDDARKYLEANLPGVETHYEPSVAPADAPAAMERLLAAGCNVIIGTSFDFVLAVQNRAANHPEADFLTCSGFVTSPNLGSYFGRMYQTLWMAGKLAGRMSQSGRIGVVAPVPIPETVRHINAFTRGVRSVNASAVVVVRWIDAWFDPALEPVVTQQLVTADADVILNQTDTTIPLETAKTLRTADDRPVYVIGYDNPDSCTAAPDVCLTSAYWNWGPMLERMVEQMAAGTWEPQTPVWEQMKPDPAESSIYLAPINETVVPGGVRMEVEGFIQQLSAPGVEAEQAPFLAPVQDNQGTVRLLEGQYFSDDDLLRMCWFVDGVMAGPAQGDQLEPAVVPAGCVGDR